MSSFMMRQSRFLLAGALLGFQAQAYNQTMADMDTEPTKLSAFGTICEKAEIWQLLTGDSSIDGANNIPFNKVFAEISSALKDYDFNIQSKQQALKALEPRIQKALEDESVPTMSIAETDDLIKQAISPFGSVEAAKKSKCGRVRDPKDKVLRKAYRKSTSDFEDYAKTYFKGQVHFDQNLFRERFAALIGIEGIDKDTDSRSYCRQLCNTLQKTASDASGRVTVPLSSGLMTQKNKLDKELQELQEKKGQCLAAEESMKEFKTVMDGQKEDVEARHKDWRAAVEAMEDAEENLDKLEDSLEEENEKLEKVIEQLNVNDKAVTDAKTSLEDVSKKEAEVKGEMDALSQKIVEVSDKTNKAKRANSVIDGLRAAVSLTTLKMRLFYEAAALRPCENAGLSLETDIEAYFHKTIQEVAGESEMREGVADLKKFCDEEALPAFKAVKKVDLTPLCPKPGADEIVTGIHKSLTDKVTMAKKMLKQIQSWFDPLKGQDAMTKEDVDANREAGEPEGLREIMTVYMYSKFYQKYLKEWTIKGKFLGLIGKLGGLIVDLSDTLEKLQKDMQKVEGKYKELIAKREQAEKKLASAKNAKNLTGGQKAAIEKALEELTADTEKMQNMYDDFMKAEEEAFKKYKAAEKKLLEAFNAGTSFQELASAADEDGLLEGPPGGR